MAETANLSTHTFEVDKAVGRVSALLLRPTSARYLFVFAHGAGAGMTHPFMESLSNKLADRAVATFRYNFPYMENGRGGLNSQKVLTRTVDSAVRAALELVPDLPLFAGGKSMGGRMASLLCASECPAQVLGLIFVGFPLHPAGRPDIKRAEHLVKVPCPMLFLQGSRDALADLSLLNPICQKLGKRATLQVIETADHSFRVLKGIRRTQEQIVDQMAASMGAWCGRSKLARRRKFRGSES